MEGSGEVAAHGILEVGEGGFGAFAHSDYYLFVRHVGYVACGVNPFYGGAAAFVNDNFPTFGHGKRILERGAVGQQPDLHEYTCNIEDCFLASDTVLYLDSRNAFAVADYLKSLG